jgi:hypothetical protein
MEFWSVNFVPKYLNSSTPVVGYWSLNRLQGGKPGNLASISVRGKRYTPARRIDESGCVTPPGRLFIGYCCHFLNSYVIGDLIRNCESERTFNHSTNMYILFSVRAQQYNWYIYLLTPWSRVLLEKLTGFAANQRNSPAFYGTRKFITVPTSAISHVNTT